MTFKMNGVPAHLRGGLERYLLDGIRPGQFLSAVLENNLSDAFSYGDEESIAGLKGVVLFLYNHAPNTAWGSVWKVAKWKALSTEERARTCASFVDESGKG